MIRLVPVDEGTRTLLALHVERFNAAVRSGDFAPLVELFSEDAVLAFEGTSFGPFAGRAAIADAYAGLPPDDELDVLDVTELPDGRIVERFAWRSGGTGAMRIAVRDGRITELRVVFD